MPLHGTAMPAAQTRARSDIPAARAHETGPGDAELTSWLLSARAEVHALAAGPPTRAHSPGDALRQPGSPFLVEQAPSPATSRPGGGERPGRWLTASMLALAVLAAVSATVSYSAQYRMVFAAKAVAPIAALEACIPDVAALIFVTLGVALALHGKRAIRARVLNVAAVVTSVAMNILAAGHGWRDLAIWAMPPIAYALASDTAIGVVRAWTLARNKALSEALADDEATPLATLGRVVLWLLRLTVAPASTLSGFRTWLIEQCPVTPSGQASGTTRQALAPRQSEPRKAIASLTPAGSASPRSGTKTAQFLALVAERHGPLASFPLADVSRVCTELAPEVDLNPGAARTALRRHVLSLQNGSPS